MAGTHTELSQHIAGLLSALRAGDPLDPRSKAEELAAEYADLGVSAQMIEKAIFRAAEMVHLKIDMEACSRPPPPSEDAPEAAVEHRSEAVAEHPAEAFAEAAAEPHANGLFLVASVEVTGNAPPALQETLPAAEHEPAPIAPDEDFEFDLTDLLGSPPAGAAEAPPDESALPSLDEFEFQLQRAGIQLSDDEPDTAPLSLKSSAAAVRRMLFRS